MAFKKRRALLRALASDRLWESSLVLTLFMEDGLPKDLWKGKRVVELGGGQGLVFIASAPLRADQVWDDADRDARGTDLVVFPLPGATIFPSYGYVSMVFLTNEDGEALKLPCTNIVINKGMWANTDPRQPKKSM